MTRLVIDVDEERYSELVSYLKSLDYVSIPNDNYEVPDWQSDELRRRSQLINEKKASYKTWESVKSNFKKK